MNVKMKKIMKVLMILLIIVLTFFIMLVGFWMYLNKNLLFSLKFAIGDEIVQYVEEPEGKVNYLYGRPYCQVKVKVKPECEDTVIELLKSEYFTGKKFISQYSDFEYISELNENELIYRFDKERTGKFVRCKDATIYVTRNADGYMYLYIDADLFFVS